MRKYLILIALLAPSACLTLHSGWSFRCYMVRPRAMKKLLVLFFLILCGGSARAQVTCYAVNPAATGSNNGTSWTNAYKAIPSTLVRGAIYYLSDGSYGHYSFSTAASGATTVEIRKAQSFDYGQLSATCSNSATIVTGWNASTMGAAQAVFATYQQLSISAGYLILNGNSQQTGYGCGGNPGSTQNSAPTNPADCGIKVDDTGCPGTCEDPIGLSASNCILKGIEFSGIGNATNENYITFVTGSNNLITHMYMHNAGAVMILYQPGSNNNTDSYNYLWGLEQTLGSNPNHGQFIQVNGGLSGLLESHSVFRDGAGTAAFSTVGSGAVTGWVIWDNVFLYTPGFSPTYPYSDGLVSCISESCALLFYDNTEVGVTGNTGINNEASGGNVTVTDNLYYDGHMPSYGGGQPITNSYNSFLVSGTSCPSGTNNVCNNTASNPFVNWTGNNFNLASENAAWDNRISLGAPYDTDANGNAFTSDRGAYQFVSVSGNVTVTPSSNNFGSFNVGFPSSNATFTVASTLSASTSLSFAFLGGNTGDFASTGAGTCGASLGAGASCTYIVKFTPSAAGARTTTLTVVDTAGTQTSALTGIGLPVPKFNYAADDYGGLLSVQCSPNPHAVTITSASQSGTTQTVIVSSVANFAVNEAMLISGTGTAMDWTYTPNNPTDGASYITAINSGTKTLTLTAVASHTVGTVTVGTVTPGRYYIQTINTPFGSGPQFCTPENHWIWLTTLGAAGGQSYQAVNGITINLAAKYGSYCNAAQALEAEFVDTLNFSTIGPDPDATYNLGGSCTTNTKLNTFTDADVSEYAAVNLDGHVSQPPIDLNAAVDNFYNPTAAVNSPMLDYFNPNWEAFIAYHIGPNVNATNTTNYRSPKFLGSPGDDSDFTKMTGPGDQFHTIPAGHQFVNPALQVMVVSPLLTLEAVPVADLYGSGQPTPYVFADPLNYSKTPMASPPSSCAVATICDLYDFLHKEYTTAAALNTAWATSSFYTTFGSSGICYGYTYSWCGSTSGAGSFAGTGVTTYTPTLNSPTSPHSVQILLNGVAIGGDCPFFSAVLQTGCTGSTGTGNILGPGVWKASLAVPLDFVRTDSNGNIEEATVAGTSGASVPSWPGTCTGSQTTVDGTITWTCLGPGIANTSTITYSTGVTSIVFNSALSGSYTVTLNYMKNGWTQGTGVMDEDGRNTTWIGTNYVCLVQPPAFANNTNYALNQLIYDNPSGSWQIVTVAGNSVGSTPSFSSGQGALTIAGGATFQSLGLPVCGVEAGSDYTAINANQTFGADMQTWLPEEAGGYFSGIQTAYHTVYPDELYGGADVVGAYNAPPRAGSLIAAQQYTDWLYTGSFSTPNVDLNANAKNSFQTQYYQRPMVTFHVLTSSQSLYGCDGQVGPTFCFSTQAIKGNQYLINTQADLRTLSYSGSFQWAGMQWWGSHPFQSSDFGFNTSLDNLYDGNDNVTASVSCSAPLAVYTCGSETSGSWNGVTLISQIASANLLWTQGSVPTPPVISPCLKCFVEEKPNDEDRTYLAPSPHSLGHLSNSSADTRPQGTEPASYERLRDVPDSSAVQH